MTLHSATLGLGVFAVESYAAGLPVRPRPAQIDWITWAFPYLHVAPRPQLEQLIPNFVPAFASDNYLVLKSAVAEGLGAMILERTTHPIVRRQRLVELDLEIELPATELHLVCAKSMRFVPRLRAVADLLIEELRRASDR